MPEPTRSAPFRHGRVAVWREEGHDGIGPLSWLAWQLEREDGTTFPEGELGPAEERALRAFFDAYPDDKSTITRKESS